MRRDAEPILSCDIRTHTPANKQLLRIPTVTVYYTNVFYELMCVYSCLVDRLMGCLLARLSGRLVALSAGTRTCMGVPMHGSTQPRLGGLMLGLSRCGDGRGAGRRVPASYYDVCYVVSYGAVS